MLGFLLNDALTGKNPRNLIKVQTLPTLLKSPSYDTDI